MGQEKYKFLLSVWSIRDDGKKVFPYKGKIGKKKGLYSVNFTNDTTKYEGYTEEQLINAIEKGNFSERGTIRMLPLDYDGTDNRNGFSPKYYNNQLVTSFPLNNNRENTNHFEEEIADEKILTAIKSRRGQPKFRDELIITFGSSCCISGCTVIPVLEAAHILPHSFETNYSITNGLLLRSDIHTLFDLNLIKITPSGVVEISNTLVDSEYEQYNGKTVLTNLPPEMVKNLKSRYEQI